MWNDNKTDALVALAAEIRASLGNGATVSTRRRWAIEIEALAAPAETPDEARQDGYELGMMARAEQPAPPAASVELVEAVRELRRCQRDYLSQPKGERIEAKGRLVGLAADRVDAALALIDSAGGAKCGHCGKPKRADRALDACACATLTYTPQPAEGDGAVAWVYRDDPLFRDDWQSTTPMLYREQGLRKDLVPLYTRPAATPQPDGGDGAVACIDHRHLQLLRKNWTQGNCLKHPDDATEGDTKLYTRPSAAAVDEAMVERAHAAYWNHPDGGDNGRDDRPAMRVALNAALADGEAASA